MRKHTQILLLALLALAASSTLSAQSVRWPNGDESVRLEIGNVYTRVPKGAIVYEITDGSCWEIINGEKSANPMAYCVKEGSDLHYYRGEDEIGYYVPSQGRYVQREPQSGKEFTLAVLKADGQLFDGDGKLRFMVEKGFDPEVLGFFLFF